MRIKWLKYAIFNTHQEPFNGKKKNKNKKRVVFFNGPIPTSFELLDDDVRHCPS